MAWPYKLYGGATRENAISGLDPRFSQALQALYAAAPPEVQAELGLNSAYRDIETQRRLWEASDKSGKWVAAPGQSKHNTGTAADLYGFGLSGGGNVSQATKDWVRANAAAQGLYFPMSHEPWHIQLQGGGSPAVAAADAGGVGQLLAGAVDPRAAVMAQLEANPWKSFTDAAPKRGGLTGESSAGGGLSVQADPGIPPLETASARLTPEALRAQAAPAAPGRQLGQLAELFRKSVVGQAAQGQALPIRRA